MKPRDELLKALIQQESAFNQDAVSPKGARGLGQVMPATAKNPGYGVTPLRNNSPRENYRFARDYLGAMLDEFGGDEKLALAAYNAGPGAVKAHKGIPPFPETQSYVSKIFGALNPISEANASEVPYKMTRAEFKAMKLQQQSTPISREQFKANKDQDWEGSSGKIQYNWGDVPVKAAENFIQSLGRVAVGTANALIHPIDTTQGVLNVANSAVQQALPDSINELLYKIKPSLKDNKELINNIGSVLKEKIGDENAIKRTLAENPAEVLSFIAPIVGGVGKLSGISTLQKAGSVLDPLSTAARITSKGIGYVAPKLGSMLGKGIATYGTHTGSDTLNDAARAGVIGGKKLEDFTSNMRGTADMNDMVEEAATALKTMRKESRNKYNQGLSNVRSDTTVLDFQPIIEGAKEAIAAGRYKGVSIDSSAANIQGKIFGEIKKWAKLDPEEYHTAGGFDALKRKIGDIRSTTQAGTPARVAADTIYHSIKNEIVKQHPLYRDVMEESAKRIKESKGIEKQFSLSEKQLENPDTAIRKFQSIPRNNANTNYGNRLRDALKLERAGAENLISKANAQALSSFQPRGLAGTITGGLAGLGIGTGNPLLALPVLLSSPRAAGEIAVGLGITTRKLKNLAKTAEGKGLIVDYLYRADALNRSSRQGDSESRQ